MTNPGAILMGLLAASSSTKSGSSLPFLLVLVVIGLIGYFVLLRPQQQRARKQRSAISEIGVGDEILTIGGIIGTVVDIDAERVTIVTGLDPGRSDAGTDLGGAHQSPTRMVLVRNAIARKFEPTESPERGVPGAELEDDESDADAAGSGHVEPGSAEGGGEDGHKDGPRGKGENR
jgi:preprotein translocase YajC subunit